MTQPTSKRPTSKAASITQQWQPPALQNAVLRLSAMARPPNTGINIDTLRQQLQQRMQTILQMHNDRLNRIYTPGSPWKSPKPFDPYENDPARGRGTVYRAPTPAPVEPGMVRDTNWYAQNAGTRPPVPQITPATTPTVPVPNIVPPKPNTGWGYS